MGVRAEIEFLAPETERPFTYARGMPSGGEPETARFVSHAVEISDLRGAEGLRLDENGGTLGHWPTRLRRFDDDDYIRGRYYPESAEIVRSALGAHRVVVFDHNVRRGGSAGSLADGHAVGRPVHHAHTDYTPRSALERLRHELGPHAEAGLSRYLQVNLWRPIRGPVRDAPLALCDATSVAPHALRAVELRYPERTGEIYYLMHEPGQRWYFASDMTVDEAWLFKNFDSAPPGPARAVPHSAFRDPGWPAAAPRESIEVRALALFYRPEGVGQEANCSANAVRTSPHRARALPVGCGTSRRVTSSPPLQSPCWLAPCHSSLRSGRRSARCLWNSDRASLSGRMLAWHCP
jgi:hypothetical protein